MTAGGDDAGRAAAGGADDTIIDAIERIATLSRALLWREGTREGLSALQVRILLHLGRHAAELRRITRLAEELEVSKPTVSDAVRSLVGKGLVEKGPRGADARVMTLRLTPAGERAAGRVEGWRDVLRGALAPLHAARKADALLLLLELIGELQDGGTIDAVRMCLSCANLRRSAGPGRTRVYSCALTGRRMGSGDLAVDCRHQVPAARAKR